MKRHTFKIFAQVLIIVFIQVVTMGIAAYADVSPGEKIDKSNWQKAEGLLPVSILNYVKKGDFILDIGELKDEPADFYSEEMKAIMKSNIGKYGLSDNGDIVEAATGKTIFVEGIPFPEIDKNDPEAATKAMYNMHYERHVTGNLMFDVDIYWIARSGFERSVKGKYMSFLNTGYPGAKSLSNPNGFERRNIITITEPYDIQGTSVMLWRYLDSRRDNNYSYVPAIRRIRRMSPASRSDAFMGSDYTLDDTASYDGKISDFNWKIISVQDALIPYVSENAQELVPDPETGGVTLSKNVKGMLYGFQEKGWTGAPWAPVNVVWVKRKTLVIEGKPKDPYYNYGTCILWLDAARNAAAFKINFDRADKYWKTCVHPLILLGTKDEKSKFIAWAGMVMVDDRTDHASVSVQCDPKLKWAWEIRNMKEDDYSLGGFQKFCK